MKRERKSRTEEKGEEKANKDLGLVGPVVGPVLRTSESSLGSITGLCYMKETKVWNEHASLRENRPGGQEQVDSPSNHYRPRGVILEHLPFC